MTTYNTYQAAKIANPELEVYKLIDKVGFVSDEDFGDLVRLIHKQSDTEKCNPADYCMTVEKFLADGYRFQAGDWYIENDDSANKIDHDDVEIMNETSKYDATIYILRAAVLEERVKMDNSVKYVARKQFDEILKMPPISQEPRIKVEYVKCEFVTKWEHVKLMEDTGESLFFLPNDEFIEVMTQESAIRKLRNGHELYRRIETPMTWKEELYNYLDNSCEMSDDFDDSFTIEIEGRPLEFNLNDDEFVNMCKLVASLNSVS